MAEDLEKIKRQNEDLLKEIENQKRMNLALEESARKDRLNNLHDKILAFNKDDAVVIRAIENEDALKAILNKRQADKSKIDEEQESKKEEKKISNTSVGAIVPNAKPETKQNANFDKSVEIDDSVYGFIDLNDKKNEQLKLNLHSRFNLLNGRLVG